MEGEKKIYLITYELSIAADGWNQAEQIAEDIKLMISKEMLIKNIEIIS
jgi:hypothetical protein